MSSVVVVQTYSSLWVGSDSAVSARVNGETYRWHEDGQKLFVVGNALVYCSGNMDLARRVMHEYQLSRDHSLQKLKRIASNLHGEYIRLNPDEYVVGENLCLGIMVNRFENGRTVVYSLEPHNDFEIVKRTLSDPTQFAIWAGGIRVREATAAATAKFYEEFNVVDALRYAFDTVSYEAVGGQLTLYEVTSAGVRKHSITQIAEKPNLRRLTGSILARAHAHLVTAETVVGQLGSFVSLVIGTGNAITKINTAGISAGHADFASAPFSVDMAGHMRATDGYFTGNITGSHIQGGSITSDTAINVTTDAVIGRNLYLNGVGAKGISLGFGGNITSYNDVSLSVQAAQNMEISGSMIFMMGQVNFAAATVSNFGMGKVDGLIDYLNYLGARISALGG